MPPALECSSPPNLVFGSIPSNNALTQGSPNRQSVALEAPGRWDRGAASRRLHMSSSFNLSSLAWFAEVNAWIIEFPLEHKTIRANKFLELFPFLAWFDPSSSTMKPFPNSWLLLSLLSSGWLGRFAYRQVLHITFLEAKDWLGCPSGCPGVSLQCQFCQDTSATSTTETTQECQSSQDVYVSAVSEVSMNGLRVSFSFKSCLDQQFCQAGSYTASVEEDVHIRTQITCCQEEM
uniref:Uncharacterized protein isoform X2 n=1 Tax=Pogona vitticeps TaxID=103695 RepID=A0ABM5ESA3_9SAUR